MDPEYRAKAFAQLSQKLLADPSEAMTIDRIVNMVAVTIPHCDGAGLMLRRPRGKVETPASTSSLVRQADTLQYELDEGPCLSAIEDPSTYVVNDTATDARWPRWCPKVAALGFRSVSCVRLATETNVLGALNLYALEPAAFTADDLDVAKIFADHAAGALQSAQVVTGLRTAMDSRQLIGVAQGMLMQRYGLDLEQAFQVLLRYSQDTNIKLRDVAERMVETGALPAEGPTGTTWPPLLPDPPGHN
jgi:GAF domain-containing protein